jgi:putative DNA primase/helicase
MADATAFTVNDEPPPETIDEWIARLAKLSRADYETVRKAEAKARGWRVDVLEDEVKKARGGDDSDAARQGRAIHIERPTPSADPVDGAALLTELAAFIARHVLLPDGAADAMAVWALHTYCFTAFRHTPRLAFTSPEKRCGKTTALDAVALLVCGPLATANITSAALFRTIEIAAPTLLIDEADTFLRKSDDLRGAINAGHKAGGQMIRCVGDDAEPRAFTVFGPAAIAAIGHLPGTIEDRSIMVRMRRATRAERRSALDRAAEAEGARLARMCTRWAQDHLPGLVDADPKLPSALFNRAADNWRALFAIADRAGGDWRDRLVVASAVLMPDDDAEGLGVRLLADIRMIFDAHDVDRIASAELVAKLVTMDDAPWSEVRHDKPLTQPTLARLLRPFGILPGTIRLDHGGTPKGYKRANFKDAWTRYLGEPAIEPPHRHNPQETGTFADTEPPQAEDDVAASNAQKPKESAGCGGVAAPEPEEEGEVVI